MAAEAARHAEDKAARESSESERSARPALVDPRVLGAGDELVPDEVERAGGVDAFFWVEEIPDEVFARMEGASYKEGCLVPRSGLRYLRVLHADAEGRSLVGEMVVAADVADEVLGIFRRLYDAGYPIRRMRLVDDYGADDDASCADDNTSAFNWRVIAGTSTISNHGWGRAIDVSPVENPYVVPSRGYVSPSFAGEYVDRSLDVPYMVHEGDLLYELFVEAGWSWGGHWGNVYGYYDYQHFEKP